MKGRESFQICKELEEKLAELEGKITSLETGQPVAITSSPRPNKHARSESPQCRKDTGNGDGVSKGSSRVRRKSLDSATSSEPMKVLIRLSSLESKVAKAVGRIGKKVECDREQEVVPCQNVQFPAPKQSHHVEVSVEPAPDSVCSGDEKLADLEDAVIRTKAKVQECLNIVASLKSPVSKNCLYYLDSIQYLEDCLGEVKDILVKCSSNGNDAEVSIISGSNNRVELVKHATVQCAVQRLEDLLEKKLKEVATRKAELVKLGKFNRQARMQLLAEKLAYESVLVGRIAQAVASCEDDSSTFRKQVVDSEIADCRRLILELKSKLKGTAETKSACYETSLSHLTRVLTARLVAQGHLVSSCKFMPQKSEAGGYLKPISSDAVEILLKQQQELEVLIRDYRTAKLERLAQTLAVETLSLANEQEHTENRTVGKKLEQQRFGHSSALTLEDQRIREAWTMAQETVNHELIQAEISHVTMRCGQTYETSLAMEQEEMFSFLASQRAILERWSDTVEGILRQEMESGIDELSRKYEEYLAKLKKDKSLRPLNHGEEILLESRVLLSEFADVMAHKALIDARIAVICSEALPVKLPANSEEVTGDVQMEDSDDVFSRLLADPGQDEFKVDPIMRMEFQYLFEQFSQKCHSNLLPVFGNKTDCETVVTDEERIRGVMDSLVYLQKELQIALDKCNIHEQETAVCDTRVDSWDDVCSKCATLRLQITSLVEYVLQGRDCCRCYQLQETVHR